jgi:hypothetical protein
VRKLPLNDLTDAQKRVNKLNVVLPAFLILFVHHIETATIDAYGIVVAEQTQWRCTPCCCGHSNFAESSLVSKCLELQTCQYVEQVSNYVANNSQSNKIVCRTDALTRN